MKHPSFDVIVVGGGHAGCEAAHVAARMGCSVALITFSASDLGTMSCNPAVGGVGKGHLVREIDALDGLMGRVADYAAIQYRLLNRSKGPAVQGPRVQTDRVLYQAAMCREISGNKRLSVITGEVTDLLLDGLGAVDGVELDGGVAIWSPQVVITTGTFLSGRILAGSSSAPGGRIGSKASHKLAARIKSLGLRMGRLKTGTPPRLAARSINWPALDCQIGDKHPVFMSFLHDRVHARQISCSITHTNPSVHDFIAENLHMSASYGGAVDSVGPRYCPSIEDKVVRFADKTSHQIFLEPEGLECDTIYPNGISTSLPVAAQVNFLRMIRGLEEVHVVQPGYAIEYDYIEPQCLRRTLELRDHPGLFLAGQINGTTGYEEAAAQGLVAGANAARRHQGFPEIIFERFDSYIGVMLDDLVTKGVTEPYRMFTSRAEYRLLLRPDNADRRLTEFGNTWGCVSHRRLNAYRAKSAMVDSGVARARKLQMKEGTGGADDKRVISSQTPTSLFDLLGRRELSKEEIEYQDYELSQYPFEILCQIRRDAVYDKYIDRQNHQIAALKKDDAVQIPTSLRYDEVKELSTDSCARLNRVRPETLGQAARIEGITSSDLLAVMFHLKKHRIEGGEKRHATSA